MHGLAIWFSTRTTFGYNPRKFIEGFKEEGADVMNFITIMGIRRKRPLVMATTMRTRGV